MCHFNPGHAGLLYDAFCTSLLQQPDPRVNGKHHKSHAAFRITLISVSVTVTTVLGARYFCLGCLHVTVASPDPPVLTLITETRDVTPRGREEGGTCPPATCLLLTDAIYMRNSLGDPQAGATAAALGGSKLKGSEWSSPISSKSLPRKRTERPSAGEPTARCLAARSRFQRSRAVLASRSAASFAAATCTWNFLFS